MSEIKVNEAAWTALPKEHQDAIHDILKQSYGEVSLKADAATPAPGAAFKLPSSVCKLLCSIAAQFGHVGCQKLPASAQAICNAGVDAGEALCNSKCK